MKSLLAQEDTDNNLQITILDNGPKVGEMTLQLVYMFEEKHLAKLT